MVILQMIFMQNSTSLLTLSLRSFLLLCIAGLPLFAQELPDAATMEKVSYGQGYDTGRQIRENTEQINLEKFLEGFNDVLKERVPLRDANGYAQGAALALQLQNENNPFSPEETLKGILAGADGTPIEELAYPREELEAATREFQIFMQQRQQAQQAQREQQMQEALQKAAVENKEVGEAFLRENAGKEGVNTTLSQLQYKVIKEGEGPKPSLGDTVVVHYEGRLLDGRKFDSSIDRGQPQDVEIKEGALIPGWVEALQLMSTGSRYRLWVPSELAYGENARPLGPNQVLEFDVELIRIK
jgi:FKBP-type peptidyl-prolyl cis-trans isomerase